MKKYLCLALSFALVHAGGDALARPRGISAAGLSASGYAQLNLGATDLLAPNFINILNVSSLNYTNAAQIAAAKPDDNQYPTASFTGTIGITQSNNIIWTGVDYDLVWSVGTKGKINNTSNTSNCTLLSGGGVTVTGCAGGSATFVLDGTSAGRMKFTPSFMSLQFDGTGTWGAAGTANLAVVRDSDYAKYVAGQIFTDEYISALSTLNPKTIRTMGWSLTGVGQSTSMEVKWRYRGTPTSLSWNGPHYYQGAWSGGHGTSGNILGTDVLTAAPADDTPVGSAWVANEVIQGVLVNPGTKVTISNAVNNGSGLCRLTVNSTATLTNNQQVWVSPTISGVTCSGIYAVTVIDGTTVDLQSSSFSGTFAASSPLAPLGTQTLSITGKTGAKFIASTSGWPPFANFDTMPAGVATFFYDSVLDRVIYSRSGINSSIPVEAQTNLANTLRANLWAVFPSYAEDDYITQWAATTCGALSSSLYFMPEYWNEVWNNGFDATHWAGARGQAMGFTSSSNRDINGYYALRTRQAMGDLIPAACGAHLLRPVLAYQAAASLSPTQTYRFQGADLAPAGVSTGVGNSVYCTFTGGTFSGSCTGGKDYTRSVAAGGNGMPYQSVSTAAFAPYSGGANLKCGTDIGGVCSSSSFTADNVPYLQNLINLMDAGNTAGAIAQVDDDIRQGRTLVQNVSCSGSTFSTPAAHNFNVNYSVAFQVTGGTSCTNLVQGALYNVTSTSSAGCAGGVICNFTIQPYVNGAPSGANVTSSNGTGTVTVGRVPVVTMLRAANSYDWTAQAIGAALGIRVEQYEAALEAVGPQPAWAANIGLTTTTSALTFTGDTTSGSATVQNIPATGFWPIFIGCTVTASTLSGPLTISTIDAIHNKITLSSSAGVSTGVGVTFSMNGSGCVQAGQIQSAIFGWRSDLTSRSGLIDFFKQFMGTDPNMLATYQLMSASKTPSWLVFPGPATTADPSNNNVYPLISGPYPNSTAYKLSDGFRDFVGLTN